MQFCQKKDSEAFQWNGKTKKYDFSISSFVFIEVCMWHCMELVLVNIGSRGGSHY